MEALTDFGAFGFQETTARVQFPFQFPKERRRGCILLSDSPILTSNPWARQMDARPHIQVVVQDYSSHFTIQQQLTLNPTICVKCILAQKTWETYYVLVKIIS